MAVQLRSSTLQRGSWSFESWSFPGLQPDPLTKAGGGNHHGHPAPLLPWETGSEGDGHRATLCAAAVAAPAPSVSPARRVSVMSMKIICFSEPQVFLFCFKGLSV